MCIGLWIGLQFVLQLIELLNWLIRIICSWIVLHYFLYTNFEAASSQRLRRLNWALLNETVLPRASEVFCVGVVFACSPQGQLNRKTCFLTTVLSCFFVCFFWILNVCILLQPNPILVYLLVYLVYLYTRSKFSRF